MTDLVMGYARGYDWDQLKYWVNSLQATEFAGDVVIVTTSMDAATIDELKKRNVTVHIYGKDDGEGNFHSEPTAAPHVERFFYLWEFLDKNKERYAHSDIVTTDTRDVVFQRNPFDDTMNSEPKWNIWSSEGLKYKDEPWGAQNYQSTFGEYFWNRIKEKEILNVGVLAGDFDTIREYLIEIFQMSLNRPIPVVDQAVFNFLARECNQHNGITKHEDAWAVQLGTTEAAVKSGAGDLGQRFGRSPTTVIQYNMLYQDSQPIIDDHVVRNQNLDEFAIVHQWDRVAGLKEKVEAKYGS